MEYEYNYDAGINTEKNHTQKVQRKYDGIVALISGAISLLALKPHFVLPSLIVSIIAIVFGVAGRKNPGQKGFATAGIILGILGLVKSAVILFYFLRWNFPFLPIPSHHSGILSI